MGISLELGVRVDEVTYRSINLGNSVDSQFCWPFDEMLTIAVTSGRSENEENIGWIFSDLLAPCNGLLGDA